MQIWIRHLDANPDSDPVPAFNDTVYEAKFLLVFKKKKSIVNLVDKEVHTQVIQYNPTVKHWIRVYMLSG
jgi:hypothetical protein